MTDMDLSPRSPGRSRRIAAVRRKRKWLPMLVLGLVVVAGGVIVTQFLTSAVDYYCNVDEVGNRGGCDEDRRIRLQGTVDEGSVEKVANTTVFTISFNGVTMPVSYDGEPGGIFKECIPVVVHGVIEDGDAARATASRSSTPTSTSPSTTSGSPTPKQPAAPIAATTVMLVAASINSALGRAGLLLMLAACVFGALAVLSGIRRDDKRLLKQGPMYALIASRRDRARRRDDAAGADHPRLLARLRPAGRLGRHADAVQHRRDVVGARGIDPAVGADPRRCSPRRSPGGSATAPTTSSSAGR